MKQTFLFGAVILLLSNLIAKFLGAFYKVPLIKILGSNGLGIYQIIYPIFALFVMLSSSGIVVALSKYIALEAQKNCKQKTKMYLKSAFALTTIISCVFAIIFGVLSPILSQNQGNSSLFVCYLAILPCIIFGGISAVFKGYFLGKNQIAITGFAVVFEQITKIIFSILFAKIFENLGVIYSVFGVFLGITISEFFTIIFYFVFYKRHKKYAKNTVKLLKNIKKLANNKQIYKMKARKISFFDATKTLLKTSFFVTLEASILPLIAAIDGIIMVPLFLKQGLNTQIVYSFFGITNGIVATLISLPVVVATSVGSAIIPNLQNRNVGDNYNKIYLAFKIVWVISLACVAVFIFIPNQIISFLYSGGLSNKVVDEFLISTDILRISAFSSLYLCMLTLSANILQGLGKSNKPAINLAFCAILRYFSVFLLLKTEYFSIYTIQIVDVLFYGTALELNIISIKKLYNLNFSIVKLFVFPICSVVIMVISIFVSQNVIAEFFSPKISTLTVCLIGGITYLTCLFLTKTINIAEIKSIIAKSR